MMLTSNTPTNNWDEFFTGDDTLLCTLDRLFDRASVFVMKGASFRGAELEIFSVEASPMAINDYFTAFATPFHTSLLQRSTVD